MSKIGPNADERKRLLAGRELLLNRNQPRDAALAEASKNETLSREATAGADEFDRNGDIQDMGKVAEANAKRTQANLFTQRAAAFRAQARELDAAIADLLAEVGSSVKVIGARLLDEWTLEAERALAPWFWELGRAQQVARNTDFYTAYLAWNHRSHNGIVNVESRAQTILSEIDHLLAHGIPDRFGCPYLDLTKPDGKAASAVAA